LREDRRYLSAVALLAVIAVVFGVFGTVAPPLAEEAGPVQPQEESSSDSVAHFMYPPSYDSGWVDISTKHGKQFTMKHGLNTTQVFVDISGKQSLDAMGGAFAWSKNYGGVGSDVAYSVVQTSDDGYTLAGYTTSSGVSGDIWLVKTDSSGEILWSNNYGGSGTEGAFSVVQTFDGGYALAGYNWSVAAANYDFCLVKTDPTGALEWSKNYGLTDDEIAYSFVQSSDGGYVLAGFNSSAGYYDFCLVKTDSTGVLEWSRNYGWAGDERAYSMVQTTDGGYALAGYNTSIAGNYDFCLVKTDPTGTLEWSRNYEWADDELAYSLVQTFDGGYALAGINSTYAYSDNFLLVRTDSSGDLQWSRNYGRKNLEQARSLVQTIDGGFALAGFNSTASGGYDFCLLRTDFSGNLEWTRNYGGVTLDAALSVVQTSDGGYALAGQTESFGVGTDFWLVKVKGEMNREHKKYLGGASLIHGWSRDYGELGDEEAQSLVQTGDGGFALAGFNSTTGSSDFCLVKTDPTGVLEWSKNYGWGDTELAFSVVQTTDGGYALAGYNYSITASDLDICLVKTGPTGTLEWSKNYGGKDTEGAYSMIQTSDGGFALAGFNVTAGNNNFCLVKIDPSGVLEWSKNYGGITSERAYSLVQTLDGGYALAGYNDSAFIDYEFCLVKTDRTGSLQWSKNYGGADAQLAYSLVQTFDGGYALAGYNWSASGGYDFCLVKVSSSGLLQWSNNYGGTGDERAFSLVQTTDGGYALAGLASSFAGFYDFHLVKTDSSGALQWSKNYGGANYERAVSLVQTFDGGYALAGYTDSSLGGPSDFKLAKTDIEVGLALTDVAEYAVTLYRGKTDLYWNYVRVRIWTIKEPAWIYGDINMDGIVDVKDLYIVGRNYGKTFSLLSLTGIIAVAGIHTVKKRKQSKQPSYIS